MKEPEEIKNSSSTEIMMEKERKEERDREKELEEVNYRKKADIERDKKKNYLNFLERCG
jgi:hypothetical protein